MGKASRWLTKLLGRSNNHHRRQTPSDTYLPSSSPSYVAHYDDSDPSKHAIAVAAATAAVAEAALTAAKAAAEVVRLTHKAPSGGYVSRRWSIQDLAASKIQSAFRGYLARRALKALKGLVKLQALVRGHFVRKQSADMLRRLQALIRVQDQARAHRILTLDSNHSQSQENSTRSVHDPGQRLHDSPLKKCGSISSMRELKGNDRTLSSMNWLDNWVESGSSINSPSPTLKPPRAEDEKLDKILEVDIWKPRSNHRSKSGAPRSSHHILLDHDCNNRSFAASDYLARYSPMKPNDSPYAEDVASLKSLHFPLDETEGSPKQAVSMESSRPESSSRRNPMTMTPMRKEFCESLVNGYMSPSYMANTESYRAKVRSHSVPRHRGDPEKRGSSKSKSKSKRSLHAFWEARH